MGMKRIWRKDDPSRSKAVIASAALAVFVFAGYGPGSGHAQEDKKARSQMIDFNKGALKSMDAKKFDEAKELLTLAVDIGRKAGLGKDNMMARTYVHLGVVQFAGQRDRAGALHSFGLAKGIRADIRLTPALETPELLALFDESSPIVEEPGSKQPSSPAPSPGISEPKPAFPPAMAPVPAAPGLPETDPSPESTAVDPNAAAAEPNAAELPAPETPASKTKSPLACSIPDQVMAGKEVVLRCGMQAGMKAETVLLYYRLPGEVAYEKVAMTLSPDGWFVGKLSGDVVSGRGLQLYFSALDGQGGEIATNGRANSPNIILIRHGKGSRVRYSEDDPMAKLNEEIYEEEYEAGLHRRRKGAFWVSLGVGMGWGYSSGGKLEWDKEVNAVSALTTNLGILHLTPEFGYLIREHLGLTLQGRFELIRQEQLPNLSVPNGRNTSGGNPRKNALAVLARAIYYLDIAGGNWQISLSGDLGVGSVRFPLSPKLNCVKDDTGECERDINTNEVVPQEERTIYRTDTLYAGPLLFGGGAGIIYHINRHLAVTLEGRALGAAPTTGFLLEAQLGLQVAFGGQAGTESDEIDEEVESWESGSEPPPRAQ